MEEGQNLKSPAINERTLYLNELIILIRKYQVTQDDEVRKVINI